MKIILTENQLKNIIKENLEEKNPFHIERVSFNNFLENKKFINKSTKQFLYHGTSINPNNFELKDDWNGDSGNTYEANLPEGYLFLTNDIREANFYGQYIIPCELKYYKKLIIKVNSDNPSREFDDDFDGYGNYGMWSKFIDGGYNVLEIKGNNKSTFVTDIYNVIPRIDLAKIFYENKIK
jgi:hypothetical protein